jgi:hypothetical protein
LLSLLIMKLSSSTNEIKQQLALNLLEASTNLNLGTYKDTNTRYTLFALVTLNI